MIQEREAQKVVSIGPMHVGVIFCSSKVILKDREDEKVADSEIYDTASGIKSALECRGHNVELVDLGEAGTGGLGRFDWIYNLAENVYGFPYQEFEITEIIEKLGVGFTGASSTCLQACLDKAGTKKELMRFGITTPAFEVYRPGEPIFSQLQFPLIVKPVHEDGSVGLTPDSVIWQPGKLPAQVRKIHEKYDQAALVEEFIDGIDITASVLGNGRAALVLPLSECIYPETDIPHLLSFEAIWQPESEAYQTIVARCPCDDLDPKVDELIKAIALKSASIMGCRDYARIDFRLKDNIPYVLEVNPNPCISQDDAGFVRSAKASGMSYVDLVNKILEISILHRSFIANPVRQRE